MSGIGTEQELTADDLAAKAMQSHRSGRFEEAERLCREALELDSGHCRSLIHLSVLHRNRGDFGEAASLAQQAIDLQPKTVDGYTQLGLSALGAGHFAEAEAVLGTAISLAPNLGPLYHNLGMALENQGKLRQAMGAYAAGARLAPNDARSRVSLGSLLLAAEDLRGARAQAETAIRCNPHSGDAHLLMAKIHVAEEKGPQAEQSIRKALELQPDSSFGHSMLGFRELTKGDFAAAEKCFRRSLEIDGDQALAYFGITQARKLTAQDRPLVARMETVLKEAPLSAEDSGYLNFGLGKAHDNLGEYEAAMGHYDEAHRFAAMFRYGERSFDAEAYASDMEAIKRLYSAELFGLYEGQGLDSELPIFVVGMMRSGTTLTEQILSSHPDVGAAGEQAFWGKRGHLAEDLSKQSFDMKQATTLARDYCRELRRLSPGTRRVTDKLPGNYLRLGMIHLALPNAKIVHCRRDPIDTCLSIYFTPNPVAPAFSHTKEGIAFAYRQYQGLMSHWRSLLPPSRFFELQYEDLVADPEPVIRALLEFLDLDWNDACLHHEQNAKAVSTPSLWQVRQPIYKASVQRWKRYEPWLGALGNAGVPPA